MCVVHIYRPLILNISCHIIQPFSEMLESKLGLYSRLGKVTMLFDLNARCGQKLDYSADCSMFYKNIDTIDQEHSGDLYCDLPYRLSMDTVVNTSGSQLIEICLCSDLKLVNGRIGDDAGISSYTFMSPNGCSVIDYTIVVNGLLLCFVHTFTYRPKT